MWAPTAASDRTYCLARSGKLWGMFGSTRFKVGATQFPSLYRFSPSGRYIVVCGYGANGRGVIKVRKEYQ